jgi:hypothetical protein
MSRKMKLIIVDGVHVPTMATRELVCKLTACGLNPAEIAFSLGCQEHEIKDNYEQELLHGVALVTGRVGGALLKQAERGDVNAARFWLQSRAKWTIPQHVELTGKDGGPVQVEARRQLLQRVLMLAKGGQAQPVPGQTETAGGQNASGS